MMMPANLSRTMAPYTTTDKITMGMLAETMLKRSSSNPTTVICTEAAVAALEKTLAPQPSLPQIVQADGNRFLRRKDSARHASQVSIYDDGMPMISLYGPPQLHRPIHASCHCNLL